MKRNFTKLITLFILTFSLTLGAMAQKGGVSGTVKDGDNGSTLPGATVMVEGTTKGSATGMEGDFSIAGVTAGSHTLIVNFLGYETKKVPVKIVADQTTKISISLLVASIQGEEVVITAQMLGQTKAINQQLNSDAIINSVSEDKLKELPDVNAAEAIGRMSGVSLIRSQGEGQKVVIRGLDPKFSSITINGVKAPSNSSTDKSVDLSMISPELLAGIEVYKSPLPNMDADAVGGTVNLVIKKAPETPKLNLKLSNGYNVMHKDMKDYSFSLNYNRRFFENKLGLIVGGNMESVNRSSDGFRGNYKTAEITNDAGDLVSIVNPLSIALNDITERRKRAGASINIDYEINNGYISAYSFFNSTDRNVVTKQNVFSPNGETDTYSAYLLQSQEMNSSLFSNMISGMHNFNVIKADWSLSYARTENNRPYDAEAEFRDLNAYDGVDLNTNTANFTEWINGAKNENNSAALHKFFFNPNKVWENTFTAALNLETPIKIGELISGYVKFGGKYNKLSRERDEDKKSEEFYYLAGKEMQDAIAAYPNNEDMIYNSRGQIAIANMIDNGYKEEEFMGGDYSMNNALSKDKVEQWYSYQKELLNEDRTVAVKDYNLTESITAAYLMTKLKIGKSLTIIPGFRIEASDNTYNANYSSLNGRYGINGIIKDTTTYQKYLEFLPHFHLKYEPVKWWDLRFSAAKTLARPDYEYIAPRTYVNSNRNEITSGNADLKHMTSMNYDLSMSFYSNTFGLFSIGGFYKEMENIFYEVDGYYLATEELAAQNGFPSRKGFYLNSFGNSEKATAYGLETELQTNFRFLPAPFNGIVMSVNVTKLFSDTKKYSYSTIDSTYRNEKGIPVKETRAVKEERKIKIPGQVPLIFNLSVGYDYKGFSCRVSGNYQGEYLRTPGITATNDNITFSFWRWDFALKQKITKNVDFFFNASNINNMKEEQYRNGEVRYPFLMLEYGPILTYGFKINL